SRFNMKNKGGPEVLALVPLSTPAERRLREVNLARVMLVAIDLVLSGEGMGLETARDLFREVWHAYPELVDEVSMTVERSMHRAELFDHQPVPVATDVFLHNLEPYTLETLRQAMEQGMKPSGLDFGGDDDSIAIIRFARPRAGEANLIRGS